MKKFEIRLQLINKVAENKWEFVWDGALKKSEYSYTTLYLENETVENIEEFIETKSKGSLKILDINEVDKEEADATDVYLELSTKLYHAKEVLDNIGHQGIGISNN